MTTIRLALAGLLALSILPAGLRAQLVELPTLNQDRPSNTGVLLPPQTFDNSAKAPNHTRERSGEWTLAGGVYFMQPVFDTNPAFVITSAGGNFSRQATFGHHLEVSPSVWLGYVSERGWGVRGRWFQYDHDAEARYTAAPGETISGISGLALGRVPVTGAVVASSNLAVNVGDFQATCSYESAHWSHLLGFGVRYTHMSQDYRASLGDGTTRIDLASGHNFNGAGPSLSVETKLRIKESGFSIYGQGHGAILFGSGKEIYSAVNNRVPQQFARDEMRVLPVGELEVGTEYQRNVGRAKVFLQSGFVGQIWWGGGNASNLDAIGLGSASHSNFGFVGFSLRAGVRY